MNKKFSGSTAKVAVAVGLDDSSRAALHVAEQYCLRTGASLRLIHVCDIYTDIDMAAIASNGMVPFELVDAAREATEDAAEKQMAALAKSMPATLRVETAVLSGSPARMINADAVANNCSFIIVGTNPGKHRFIPRGLSCALSLVSDAQIPVMVVGAQQTLSFTAEPMRILMPDDLREQSLGEVRDRCAFALALNGTELEHLHINGLTEEALAVAIDNAMSASYSQPDAGVSPRDIFAAVIRQLESKLKARIAPLQLELAKAHCHYHSSLITERRVTDVLERVVQEKKTQLVLFGRHRSFHRKPFSIGQMPMHAMLALPCPIMIFPEN